MKITFPLSYKCVFFLLSWAVIYCTKYIPGLRLYLQIFSNTDLLITKTGRGYWKHVSYRWTKYQYVDYKICPFIYNLRSTWQDLVQDVYLAIVNIDFDSCFSPLSLSLRSLLFTASVRSWVVQPDIRKFKSF